MHRLVTVKVVLPSADVTEHLLTDLRNGWEIVSVTGIPTSESCTIGIGAAYAVMAVVLGRNERQARLTSPSKTL